MNQGSRCKPECRGSCEASACGAVAPLLAAFRRGTKRSRLRLLAVVCRRGHVLLEVFPTAQGPFALWEESLPIYGTRPRQPRRWLVEPISVRLLDLAAQRDRLVGGDCRCTEASHVRVGWIYEQLNSGATRAVAPPS